MPKKLVKGPKDGKITQTSFVGNAKSLFPSLKPTKDLVLLSIAGNELCAGEYLEGIVRQAVANHEDEPGMSEQRGKTTFLIADEIYWHNLKSLDHNIDALKDNIRRLGEQYFTDHLPTLLAPLGLKIDDFNNANAHRTIDDKINLIYQLTTDILKNQALYLGDQYFTDNLAAFLAPLGLTVENFNKAHQSKTIDQKISIINKLAVAQGKNFEIVRWRTWVAQDSENQIERMMPLYESVEGLRDSITSTAEIFAKRHCDEGDEASVALWKHRSEGYLTEECPSVMWLAASLGYNFVIYPGEIMPPFITTKNYFVVGEHKARIEHGINIKETCAHSEFCMHVQDPKRLVNWLEVQFQKSHIVSPKKPIVAEGASGPGLTFFPPPPPVKGSSSDESTVKSVVSIPEEEELKAIRKKSERSDNLNLEQRVFLDSMVRGLHQALGQEQRSLKQRARKSQEHDVYSSSELTAMFRGITEGIMNMEKVSESTKIGMLSKLVEDFTSKHILQPSLHEHMEPLECSTTNTCTDRPRAQ